MSIVYTWLEGQRELLLNSFSLYKSKSHSRQGLQCANSGWTHGKAHASGSSGNGPCSCCLTDW